MEKTFCGKNCETCGFRETLSCGGCLTGPGRRYGGDCEIAACCREKGHENCSTCSFGTGCMRLRKSGEMPELRQQKLQREAQRTAEKKRRASVLGVWLWVLFWLVVPSTVAGFMSGDLMMEQAPGVYVLGTALAAVSSVVYGLILLKLAAEEDYYRTAGICALVSAGASAAASAISILSGRMSAPGWTMLFTVPAAVVALVGEYNEYMGHAAVLHGVESDLAEKWGRLWKWYIGLFLGMAACIVIILIAPILGLLVFAAAAVGNAVVGIMKLVYLYRTAKVFREYAPQQ